MAWTGNFKDQIDDLAGTLAVTDDDAIQQWIIDGCYDIIQKSVAKNGEDEVWKFVAKSGNQTSNNIDIDEIRTIASVFLNGIFANKGKFQLKAKYADALSIYAATANNPVWYLDDSKLSIYPAPTGGAPANYYYIPEYAITNWNSSTSSIDNYPSEYYYHAMLYAAIQVLHRRMLDSATPTVLSVFDITQVSPNTPSISASSITITGTAPTYTKPSVPSAPSLATISYTGPSTSDVSTAPTISTTAYVLPSASTAFSSRLAIYSGTSTFSSSATIPALIGAAVFVNSTVGSIAKADISGDVPTYSTVTVTAGTLGALASQSIADLTIGTAAPAVPAIATIAYDASYGAVTLDAVSDVTTTGTVVSAADSNIPVYLSQIPPDRPDFEASIVDEDTELVASKAQQYSTDISAFQAEIGDSVNLFNKQNAEYQQKVQQGTQNANTVNQQAVQNLQKELQRAQAKGANAQAKVVQDAIQTVQGTVSNNTSLISKFTQDLALYQAKVNSEVQAYTQNLQKTTQLWQQTNTTRLQEHSQRMQDQLNIFNKENARYQANIQAEMTKNQSDTAKAQKDADLEQQTTLQLRADELQKFQADVAQYQAAVNTEVQVYTQNLQMEIQSWTTEQANAIQQYQMESQDNVKTADIANQKNLAQGQSDLQVAIRDKDKQLERELQNAINLMGSVMQNNQSLVAKYQAELGAYQTDIQNELNEFNKENAEYQALLQKNIQDATFIDANDSRKIALYQAELSHYQADVGTAVSEFTNNLQKFQADMQKSQVDYQWLQDQYGRLKMEYEKAFATSQPQGQA